MLLSKLNLRAQSLRLKIEMFYQIWFQKTQTYRRQIENGLLILQMCCLEVLITQHRWICGA